MKNFLYLLTIAAFVSSCTPNEVCRDVPAVKITDEPFARLGYDDDPFTEELEGELFASTAEAAQVKNFLRAAGEDANLVHVEYCETF